ncbi:uncharacterized protein LOC126991279 [Eriocheir sinensis]|uniref:uncharacterized protein LOC126991279 n=1 Tax=Eriocheir sinensis TaxID=95602 RepID=UPI0021C93F0B|nr:uncharacterized protein LOC126991279 [Eriocheir sinensis]
MPTQYPHASTPTQCPHAHPVPPRLHSASTPTQYPHASTVPPRPHSASTPTRCPHASTPIHHPWCWCSSEGLRRVPCSVLTAADFCCSGGCRAGQQPEGPGPAGAACHCCEDQCQTMHYSTVQFLHHILCQRKNSVP